MMQTRREYRDQRSASSRSSNRSPSPNCSSNCSIDRSPRPNQSRHLHPLDSGILSHHKPKVRGYPSAQPQAQPRQVDQAWQRDA